ncbi:MAG: AbrB/MazE/SpoVT family DNA-binding domain-containing protein [Candidatus Wildermuthbacteria bacterium]|nr:AbrB/MazE/SpoVT family DNA-binding domain-containing protein [Candidatus Wildermuthbacteria bacterium]
MTTKIQKWGNSLAVRLPKEILVRIGLEEGTHVKVDEHKMTVVIKKIPLLGKTAKKGMWKKFMVPTNKKKENISGKIDEILYGKPR